MEGWGMVEEGGWRKGPWTPQEDTLLLQYVNTHGEGRWNSVSKLSGLKRNGKSCRLRWVNYLRPDLKRGQITPHEETIILQLHATWGNRWSAIARSLPGRTDNEIKNYWRTHFKKKSTKASSGTGQTKKSKTSLLIKHQFQQQQQYQLQQQQQFTTVDMRRIMSLLEECENRVTTSLPQARQELCTRTCTISTSEELQGLFYCNYLNRGNCSSEISNGQDLVWDGLWNTEDTICATTKVGMHNYATSL